MRTLTLAALAAAERLVNEALRFDPATRARLKALAGKVVHLHITEPAFDVYLHMGTQGIELLSHCELPVHCKVSGRLSALLTLATSEQLNITGAGVQVSGQTQLLLALKNCLGELDIDWADWLAQYLGDELAGPLGAAARRVHEYGKQQLAGARDQLEPYLSEELKVLPTATALANFSDAVDQLAQDTDRLEARLRALQASLATRH
ncbi:SCP2 sterol-binding domain-containing protein [Simiduia sp. 21SJ11W-1]|uniref:ubiquinone biosynthesis accessory factor UbiJ n=1 Tax=Simiduia sp. 21SJ11W-1 TaxID=2909669 RepID=UPI00209D6A63|nr:SCP2 sterol-binding domain-containing protein [Simiduia sp. 21SJ11W-1]UTA48547.1 SCP2 sterol-binding domain-containing protein [Simiduia sp. 21SJ11W-1]